VASFLTDEKSLCWWIIVLYERLRLREGSELPTGELGYGCFWGQNKRRALQATVSDGFLSNNNH